jgi:hypothetical protein
MSKSVYANQFSSNLPKSKLLQQERNNTLLPARGVRHGTLHHDEGKSVADTVRDLCQRLGVNEMDSDQFLEFSSHELESRRLVKKIQFPWFPPILFVRQDHDKVSPEYLKELRLCMGLPLNAMCYLVDLASDILGDYEADRGVIVNPPALERIGEIGNQFANTGFRPPVIPTSDGRGRRDGLYGEKYQEARRQREERNKLKKTEVEKALVEEEQERRSVQAEKIIATVKESIPTEKEKRESLERLRNRTERIAAENQSGLLEYHARNKASNDSLYDYSKLRTFMEIPIVYVLFGIACTAAGAGAAFIFSSIH